MTSRIKHNDPQKSSSGALSLTYHYEMLADEARLAPFVGAINSLCPGKIVFESGTGSGILSILAAKAGAKRVFCSEIDPIMAERALVNIKKTGFAGKVTLFNKSTLDITPADLDGMRPDVIMAENLSTWQVTEPENEVMNHLRSTLAHENTIAIPARALNYFELCESRYTFMDLVELRTHYFEFSGITPPVRRSEPILCTTFDYSGKSLLMIDKEMPVKVASSGTVNSLRLTSPLVVSEQHSFSASDSLMPPVVVPLEREIAATAGETLIVRVAYRTNSLWEEFKCEIRRPS